MIKFSLVCASGHDFEAWFSSNEDFDTQCRRKLVLCPDCGGDQISKSLMAPNVGKRSNKNDTLAVAPFSSGLRTEVTEKLRQLKAEIQDSAEDVGAKFPEEARKIHYGEAEARGIYGTASLDEAAGLHEEGIEVFPIPELPEDKN